MDAWHRLRQDLIHDAFAYRPLPPMKMDGLFTSRLSGRLRAYVAWAPHAAVVTAGLLSMTIAASATDGDGIAAVIAAAFSLVPILLTMVRPVAAFAPGDLVDFIKEDDAGLLDPLHRGARDAVHVNQLLLFFLRQMVERKVKHPLIGKVVRRSNKFHAHDEANECKEGDLVVIEESRPLSKTKTWKVSKIVEKARSV